MKKVLTTPTKSAFSGLVCRPLEEVRKNTFVRVLRHKPRVVYAIHQPLACEDGVEESVIVTSQSSKALTLLGQACLDAQGSAHTPFLTAHVEYGFNKYATHPKPESFSSDFTLAEFAAHHHKWKQEVTEYALPPVEETL